MEARLVDTSIFLNIVNVPGSNSERREVIAVIEEIDDSSTILFLPWATIMETGNHIFYSDRLNEHHRREAAKSFVDRVREAVDGIAPWRLSEIDELSALLVNLNQFPQFVVPGGSVGKNGSETKKRNKGGISFGDLTIATEFNFLRRRFPSYTVSIWSLDQALSNLPQQLKP